MKEYWRFIRFALFSASAGLIEIGSFALLNEFSNWSYWPCYLIALLCSILWNFTLNRKFTFRSAANVPVAMLKVLGFYAVFTPATTLLGSYLADTLMWNGYLVTGINMGLNFVTEYLYQRYFVYRNSLDTINSHILACIGAIALICSCGKGGPTIEDGEPSDVDTSAGTCIPITFPDEFIFLSWYELIDINADSKLEEFKSPGAEWRMRKLKEAGFNTYFDYRLTFEEADALLTLADKVGMNIIVECDELHDPATTQMTVEAMSAHPSLYAYNVWDEPEVFEYPEVIRRIQEIYKYDKVRPCSVNLFPNYGWDDWVEELYLETIRTFLKTVPVSFLSFDYYPIIIEDGQKVLREAWYHNLEDIRTAALETNIPIWGFALVKAHNPYPWPTLADLRLQQFSNLVYGAVAFQYFTTRSIVWKDSETEYYPMVKQVNEELKMMEKIFLGAEIKDVWHTGKEIPRGTKRLSAYPTGISEIVTGDGGTVVSYFTSNNKEYIAFVNRSCTEETTLQIRFDGQSACVAKDGTESPVAESYTIEPGDIRIFTWE